MKSAKQLLNKHITALIFLVIYTLLCIKTAYNQLLVQERMKMHPGMSGIAAGGEWGGVPLLLVGSIFFLISCVYAIGKKEETKFYLFLISIIVIETIITINIR